MAPARSSANRARRDNTQQPPQSQNVSPPDEDANTSDDLFLDPLMGTPLAIYVEKDVDNRDEIVELITVCRLIHLYPRRRRVLRCHTPIAGLWKSARWIYARVSAAVTCVDSSLSQGMY